MSAALDQRDFENGASLDRGALTYGVTMHNHARAGTGHCHTSPPQVGRVHALHVFAYRP